MSCGGVCSPSHQARVGARAEADLKARLLAVLRDVDPAKLALVIAEEVAEGLSVRRGSVTGTERAAAQDGAERAVRAIVERMTEVLT